MGTCYERLSLEEREEISRMLVLGTSLRAIGRSLKRNISTISRELYRAYGNRYLYWAARSHKQAVKNGRKRRLGRRKLFLNLKLKRVVDSKLKLSWSPEQIAEWLKREYAEETMRISPETIYSYLYVLPKGELKKELLKGLKERGQILT